MVMRGFKLKETAINIKAQNKPGVLRDITDMLAAYGINITYTHLFLEGKDSASIYMELEYVENVEKFINIIRNFEEVSKIEIHRSLGEIYGKRIIIIGGGAQVAMVAQGAITEADRHNIRGERISVDTIPLVGENELAEAVSAVGRLPRVGALVLAGSLMGGKISEAIEEIKIDHEVIVISLNMPGGVTEKADLVVTDPVQAGVMAVMAVADTAIFDIKKIRNKKF
jgi:energy-converting hydrogenase B subunit Q